MCITDLGLTALAFPERPAPAINRTPATGPPGTRLFEA